MAMTFDKAFELLVGNEGGYVNNPKDPGGETKYGISKRSYPEEDIKGLTLDRAKVLYLKDFWGPAGCEALPDLLRFELFDLAVNTSARGNPTTAIKLLQRAVFAQEDGQLGPKTLLACNSMEPSYALRRLHAVRLHFYTSMKPAWWEEFGKGVVNRIAENMLRRI